MEADKNAITLLEALTSPEFLEQESCLTVIVGTNSKREIITADLRGLPHLVIAGATGTGKSSFAHGIIASILKNAPPEQVRLLLCDTKLVEFGCYSDVPHLLIPSVTDKAKICGALQWLKSELLRRLRLFAGNRCRSIQAYNEQAAEQYIEKFPYIIAIIDDAAVVAGFPEAAEAIRTIAQNGRIAGIHLALITQSPGNRNLSDIIKNSIPARAVFRVLSTSEERLMLDHPMKKPIPDVGMMYFRASSAQPVQLTWCCRVDDEAIIYASEYAKSHYAAPCSQDTMGEIYNEVEKEPEKPSEGKPDDAGDELLPAAVDVFLETKQASVSMLQRRLKLGYARAAQIVDEMEARGIVGPFMGSKPREILITKEQWQQMQSGSPVQTSFGEDDPVPDKFP